MQIQTLREKARELWVRCGKCGLVMEKSKYETNAGVCSRCGHHHRLSAEQRAAQLFDPGSFQPLGEEIRTEDPLNFQDGSYYQAALELDKEAMVYGTGAIAGMPCVAALMDFSVFGGSMGTAVGEIFRRACALCVEDRRALIAVTSSGGVRMQEGTPALLQMAKVMIALEELAGARLPCISLLCDPTCGGVAASFATAADVILAEPGALICFSGPRVSEQTIGISHATDFSRAESLYERGLVDMVVPRARQREVLAGLLAFFRERR